MLKAHISFIHAAKHLRLLFYHNQISKWKKNGSIGIVQGHVCLSINTHDDSCWDAPLPALFFSHFHCMILMPLNQRLQNHSGRFPADLTSLFTLWVRPSSSMSPVPIIQSKIFLELFIFLIRRQSQTWYSLSSSNLKKAAKHFIVK